MFIDGSAGINTDGTNQIEIYPNPTADKTTLRFEAVKNIKVYDNLGRLAFAQTDVNQKVRLSKSNLGSGHFIVEITDETAFIEKI